MAESLKLKWGTIKGWDGMGENSLKIIERFYAEGESLSAMADHPDDARRLILCELIDKMEGDAKFYLDWDGTYITREEAKKYVMEYGKSGS